MKRFLAALALIVGVTAACSDLNDLEKKVDSLESRVTALEKLIPAINSNIEGLQTLMAGGTINSATQKDGVWTLVLSNGETLTLTQGSVGVGNAPVMSVDKDGYWMVDYGKGAQYILMNGSKVKAVGTDGITPKFGIDASGYWTVSYDGGKTFEQVKGADGQPVSALPSGDVQDPYFKDVELVDGNLVITLRDGETVIVPVIADFLCSIDAEGVQTFAAGETRPFNVTLKGVKSVMLNVPHGWTAVLGEPADEKAVLTVTAPEASSSLKAVIADSGSDISILAFSAQNYAAIAKLRVETGDGPAVITPVANVTAGEATESSLTYNVATSDVTSWKYIHVKEGETAPDAATIAADGTEGSGTSVTVEGLEQNTAYVLYVLPLNGAAQGNVASCTHKTTKLMIASYYALYNAGETITVGGKSFSKEVNGEATLIEADSEITTNGVYFIKEGVTASYTGTGGIKKLIIIGDKEGSRSTFKTPVNTYIKLNGGGDGTGYLVFHNLVFDQSATSTQYAITVNFNESFPLILFSDCKIIQNSNKPIFYISSASRSIKELTFTDCDCNVTSAQQFVSTSSSTASYGTFSVNNCVFYGDGSVANFKFHGGNAVSYENIVFTNNTLVNIVTDGAYYNCGTIAKATMTGNIFYMGTTISKNHNVLLSKNAAITGGSIKDNISYTGQSNNFMAIYGGSDNWFEGVEEIEILESDPFTGGTFNLTDGKFIPGGEYASYGAKR